MKQIENIFSKKKEKAKFTNPKIPIIIDTREKQSLVASYLINKKAKIEFEKLDIGDYLIQDTIIERKSFQDLISSLLDKRLQTQLTNLKKYQKHFLIIEGFDYDYEERGIHKNALKGLLLSIAVDFQMPVVYTSDEEDTAEFLILLAKKYSKPKQEISLRQSKDTKSIQEQKQFILEGFPGIGPTLAKRLLKKYPKLKDLFNAKEEDLTDIHRFDERKRKKFFEILRE